jgi:hypothetical protein
MARCDHPAWPDGYCVKCGEVVDEPRVRFAKATRERAELFMRLKTPASAAKWSGKPKK